MNAKRTLFLFGALILISMGLYLYFDWGNISGKYLLPNYPGLVRLGSRMGFPSALEIAWESDDSILFLGTDWGPGGYFYRYWINEDKLEKVFPDFRGFYFQFSPNKKQIAFTGWLDKDSPTRKLWISDIAGQPMLIGDKFFSNYDLDFLGWLNDGESLILDYNCDPKFLCLGIVNRETQTISKVYEMAHGPIGGYESVSPEKVIFESNINDNAITEFDIYTKNLAIQSFGNSIIGEVKSIPSKRWLVGLIGHGGTKGGQLFFITNDYKCEEEPFKNLFNISQLDVLETNSGITLLLSDGYGSLYTLNLNEALKSQNISMDQFFKCEN